jgi:hypothetical protein
MNARDEQIPRRLHEVKQVFEHNKSFRRPISLPNLLKGVLPVAEFACFTRQRQSGFSVEQFK